MNIRISLEILVLYDNKKRGHFYLNFAFNRFICIFDLSLARAAREISTLIGVILIGTFRTEIESCDSRVQKPCKSTLIFAFGKIMRKREIDGCAGMPYEHHRALRPKCRFIIKIDRVESAIVDLHQDVGDIKSIMQVIERHPVTSVTSMLWAPLRRAPAGTRISRFPSAEGRPGHRYSTRDGIFN